MPNRQKEKGSRFELATVKLLSAIGLSAAKVPLSGGAGGAFSDDITLKWFDGAEARFEAKARANGFKQIYGWLGECSGLFLKADRKPPLVVLRMEDFLDLMKRAHANENKQQS